MMNFAQAWERQERLRHQSLVQQLKTELTAKNESFANPPRAAESPLSSPSTPSEFPVRSFSQPKLKKPLQSRQERMRAVAIR